MASPPLTRPTVSSPLPIDFDVFNGDADGICALHQLRLAEPRPAILITGAKRQISLLARVRETLAAAGSTPVRPRRVTVLDIAIERNRAALDALLADGARVEWFDHHEPGPLPVDAALTAHIDTDPQVCTSILVDRQLGGRFRRWAICAAYGDGMASAAESLAGRLGREQSLSIAELDQLRVIGEAINYNAYAADTGTALLDSVGLYRRLAGVVDPLTLADWPLIVALTRMSVRDLGEALKGGPILDLPTGAAWLLPPTLPARRARGLVAQHLKAQSQQRTVMIVAPDGKGHVDISIRCPAGAPRPASAFARRYDGGGGRATAAGIDRLPITALEDLLADFEGWLGR